MAWTVPPALFTAVFWITSPPDPDDCSVPVLTTSLPDVSRISAPGWLASTRARLMNVSWAAPNWPAPSMTLDWLMS